MKAYAIRYRMIGSEEKLIDLLANNKEEAYEKAFYEAIPEREGEMPYSAWVSSVTYQNGNVRYFNTSEGNAF